MAEIPEEKFCPDGLLFDATDPNSELCDYPFNVDCGDREYVRKCSFPFLNLFPRYTTNNFLTLHFAEEPEPGLDPKCYRANGFFNHEDPTVCTKYYNCVHGYPHAYDCPTPLVFDEAQVQLQTSTFGLSQLSKPQLVGRAISPFCFPAGHLCEGGAVLFVRKEM